MSNQESNRNMRIVGWGIIGLVAVIAISIAVSAFIGPRPGYPFPFHFGWLGGIFLIFIVFWIARWFFWPRRGGYYYRHQYASAESILKERYARGEITKEQFEQMMSDIERRT